MLPVVVGQHVVVEPGRPVWPGMQLGEVHAVLADLQQAGCRCWVAGGWGVDALVGEVTRAHRDLDLAVDAEDETEALAVLGRRGYQVETDWRPVRVELAAPGLGWVDVHPVVFDTAGHGRQAGLGGECFGYPVDAFTEGSLDGVGVRCLSRVQQVRFHTGYPLREVDVHDLHLLQRLPPDVDW